MKVRYNDMKAISKTIVLALLIGFAACDKINEPNENPPVITTTSPNADQLFHVGDTVFVKGTIADNAQVNGYSVDIKNLTLGTNILSITGTPQIANVVVDTFKIVTTAASYRIVLYGEDNAGHFTNKNVDFTVQP